MIEPTTKPMAEHVELVPGGVSSVREITGISRATQGERRILTALQIAINLNHNRPVDEFWQGVWGALAEQLKADAIYLLEYLPDYDTPDFAHLRVLFVVDANRNRQVEDQNESAMSMYNETEVAEAVANSNKPLRLDLRPGAIWQVPISPEAQKHNQTLARFHYHEIRRLAQHVGGMMFAASPDGSNHFQLLPSNRHNESRQYYFGIDCRESIDQFRPFEELFNFIHERLMDSMGDLIDIVGDMANRAAQHRGPGKKRISVRVKKLATVHRADDSEENLVLIRDVVRSGRSMWWGTECAGLFSVIGATGAELSEATDHIGNILDNRLRPGTLINQSRAAKLFTYWHKQIYKLASAADMPLRVSGSLIAYDNGRCRIYSFGTAAPIVYVMPGADNPVRFRLPKANLPFLGYNPAYDSILAKARDMDDLPPSERISPDSFSEVIDVEAKRPNMIILLGQGWLQQLAADNRYTMKHFLADLRKLVKAGHASSAQKLTESLMKQIQNFELGGQDATILVYKF